MKKSTYAGSKAGSGSFQQIINEIPPINHFVAGFLGNCPLTHYFKDRITVEGFEIDPEVIDTFWKKENGSIPVWIHEFSVMDHTDTLIARSEKDAFIYLDPPYLLETRKSKRKMYRYEFSSEQEHTQLLEIAKTLPGRVAISGYPSALYDKHLTGWRTKTWSVGTRNGRATECLWMNYPEPTELFTYDFLGRDNTDRQRIKRKLDRISCRLERLPHLEAMAIVDRLQRKFLSNRD